MASTPSGLYSPSAYSVPYLNMARGDGRVMPFNCWMDEWTNVSMKREAVAAPSPELVDCEWIDSTAPSSDETIKKVERYGESEPVTLTPLSSPSGQGSESELLSPSTVSTTPATEPAPSQGNITPPSKTVLPGWLWVVLISILLIVVYVVFSLWGTTVLQFLKVYVNHGRDPTVLQLLIFAVVGTAILVAFSWALGVSFVSVVETGG